MNSNAVLVILERMLQKTPYRKLAARYGVDDRTIRRWYNGETRESCWYVARDIYWMTNGADAMTCVKTGAALFIENYGFTVPADVYQIDPGFYIFRWMPEGKDYLNNRKPTHRIDYIVNSGEWFHRDDLGITVVPAKYVCVFSE